MDIKPIANKSDLPLRTQQQAQIEQINALVKTLGLKPGDQFIAQVTKVVVATPNERTELLKSIDTAIAQLEKNAASPANRATLAQLLEQRALIQQPTLRLISLAASNPLQATNPAMQVASATPQPAPSQSALVQPASAQPASLPATPAPPAPSQPTQLQSTHSQVAPSPAAATNILSYSTQAVSVGQTLLMQLATSQRVQVLEPISQDQSQKLLDLITTLSAAGKPLPGSLVELVRSVQTINTQALATIQTQEAISETLRQLLPLKDRGQDLLGTLPKLTQFVQQLPPSARSEWLSSELQASLKTLANHIRLHDQLSNPKLLAMTLHNNGQRFEAKLAQALGLAPATSTANTSTPTTAATSTNPSADKALAATNNLALGMTAGKGQAAMNASLTGTERTAIERLAAQDLKGALLGVLAQLERERSLASVNALSPVSEAGKVNLANALPQLLGLLVQKQPTELSQKQLRAQLVMLMHQYTLGSLAKIQLQQIHSLNHQQTQADQPQPTQSWQMEIPIRQGQEVHPLNIQLEQKWVDDAEEGNNKEVKRVRQWNVMLGFELVDLGRFYAQLGLLGERLSLKFWAEQEQTLNQVQAQLATLKEQLEQEGMQITQLQCVPGLPPTPKIALNYSLVDIKT